jgi:hypothetical protein
MSLLSTDRVVNVQVYRRRTLMGVLGVLKNMKSPSMVQKPKERYTGVVDRMLTSYL